MADSDFEALVEDSELIGVSTLRICGERHADTVSAAKNILLRIVPNIKRKGDESYDCRYNFATRVQSEDGEVIASIDIDVVATFSFSRRVKVTSQLIERFVEEVGYFVVFPYAREGIESTGTRLGIGAITLGILQQAGQRPMSASFVPASQRRLSAAPAT